MLLGQGSKVEDHLFMVPRCSPAASTVPRASLVGKGGTGAASQVSGARSGGTCNQE